MLWTEGYGWNFLCLLLLFKQTYFKLRFEIILILESFIDVLFLFSSYVLINWSNFIIWSFVEIPVKIYSWEVCTIIDKKKCLI